MDEKITPSKRVTILIIIVGVIIGFSFLFYNFYLKEMTWKQTVNNYVNEVRLGSSYYESDRTSELIFLLKENGFETYSVKALKLKGFCVIELDESVYSLSNKLKLKVFDECLEPVNYVKLTATDGNYFIDALTGEYVPRTLARGSKKAIVVKDEEV